MDPSAALTGCAPRLESEAARLAMLQSLELLDTPAETSFDAITHLAHQVTGRPIALIGLVDAERTWFKSRVGLDAAQSPRDISFCGFAIAAHDVFEVPDAHADPLFRHNPLVTSAPHVRFYAGVPLRIGGLPVGTVCVVDHQPYRLDDAQRDGLRRLGHLTTELLERRLASRAKSEFIGHMNHELRTPLNAILGFGQLLQRQLAPDSASSRHAGHVVGAGRHLLSLIDESLDLMRLEAGVVRIEATRFDLVPLMGAVCALAEGLAMERSIELQLDSTAAVPARADPKRVTQALLNLTGHAIKRSPPGGRVTLSAGSHGGEAWVTVADKGPGLGPEQIARMFKPFEPSTLEPGDAPGGGLGLALSRRLAAAMGGRIDVVGASGDGGALFTLSLPAA